MSDYDKPKYKDFYNNPFIKSIANNKRWTISTTETKDNKESKVPIDVRKYIDNPEEFKRNYRALYRNEKSLVDLKTLCDTFTADSGEVTNNAYFLNSIEDEYIVLDIEKTCPDNLKQQLLKTPYIYGEVSMSGEGYHLVFKIPDNYYDYSNACGKAALKEEHGWYEILQCHYVTFTRKVIPPSDGTVDFVPYWESIAKTVVAQIKQNIDFTTNAPSDIPLKDRILQIMSNFKYDKKPDYFNNDMSKWEFGFVGAARYKLRNLLQLKHICEQHEYTDNEKLWLLYWSICDKIPYRPKHDTYRDGIPWLMYLCKESINTANDNYKQKGGKKK